MDTREFELAIREPAGVFFTKLAKTFSIPVMRRTIINWMCANLSQETITAFRNELRQRDMETGGPS